MSLRVNSAWNMSPRHVPSCVPTLKVHVNTRAKGNPVMRLRSYSCVVMCNASQIPTGNSSNSASMNRVGSEKKNVCRHGVSRVNFSKYTQNGLSILASASLAYHNFSAKIKKLFLFVWRSRPGVPKVTARRPQGHVSKVHTCPRSCPRVPKITSPRFRPHFVHSPIFCVSYP